MTEIVIHDGPAKKKDRRAVVEAIVDKSVSNVVYVGRIPHGFYEKEMRGFFEQFGNITKLRLSRNKKTGKSKHYAFIQFEVPEVAAIVAESMHNYLLMESILQVRLVPVEKCHPSMWVGANRVYQPGNMQMWQRMKHNRIRSTTEQQKLVEKLLKKDGERRVRLKAAGIDFDYPDIRDVVPQKSKKISFSEEEETS